MLKLWLRFNTMITLLLKLATKRLPLASRSTPKGPFNVAPEKQQTATPPSALAAMTKLLTEPLIQTMLLPLRVIP